MVPPKKGPVTGHKLHDPGIHPARYYTPRQAGDLLSLSPQTLASWRVQHRGPAFVKLTPKVVRYKGDALLAFIMGGADA
jgi:hypothetical protein